MKVAIVTGSAKGLGAEIAKFLAHEKYTVVVHYRKSADEANKVLAEIKKGSPESIAICADVTNEEEVGKLIAEVVKKFSRIDLLVNNVGNFVFKEFNKTSNAEFRDMIETNLYSTLYVSRAVLPVMRRQKSGNIINIGAVGAERLIIRENSTPYFLGKTGVYVLTKVMAAEEAKNKIRINMISPSSMKTDIFEAHDFPSGRPASYSDVMHALSFLISADGSYINGANIEVSGGFVPGLQRSKQDSY